LNKEEDVHSNDNSVLQEMFKEEDDTAIKDTSDTACPGFNNATVDKSLEILWECRDCDLVDTGILLLTK
jgi:ribosomal protein L37AE/L43A